MGEETNGGGGERPSTLLQGSGEPSLGTSGGEDDEARDMIVPGNNRAMQARRKPRRKLFGKKLKEAFLAELSCTANVAASAAAVGVAENTVYSHRRNDPEFREAFWIALEQGVAKLVALRLQREIERAEGTLQPGLEAQMDGPPDARQIADLVKLMAALRDLTRNLSGVAKAGRPAQAADLDTTCRALAKRLKAFGVRQGVVPPGEAAAGA